MIEVLDQAFDEPRQIDIDICLQGDIDLCAGGMPGQSRQAIEGGSVRRACLLRHAIRLFAVRMTESRPAGISTLPLIVAPVGASVQTGLAIGRRPDGGRGLSVAFLGGSLGLRQAHGSVRSKSKTWRQSYQQNAQHKAHDGISLLLSYSFQRRSPKVIVPQAVQTIRGPNSDTG